MIRSHWTCRKSHVVVIKHGFPMVWAAQWIPFILICCGDGKIDWKLATQPKLEVWGEGITFVKSTFINLIKDAFTMGQVLGNNKGHSVQATLFLKKTHSKYLDIYSRCWGTEACNWVSNESFQHAEQKAWTLSKCWKRWGSETLSSPRFPLPHIIFLSLLTFFFFVAYSLPSAYLIISVKCTTCFHGNSSWLPQVDTTAVWLK